MTWRSEKIVDENGVNISELMPYNTGVVFSRSKQFWKDCIDFGKDKNFGWYTDQASVAVISDRYNTLKLHCDNFNYTPKKKDEDLSSRYVVHYKGNRKNFILGD